MKLGYSEGMISLYDIGNVTMLYEPSNPLKVFKEFNEIITKYEEEESFNQNCNNLKFLLRLTKCILSNKEKKSNFAVRIYLLDFIEHNFDFAYSYNWQELKSILFYCIYMRNLKSFEKFSTNLKNPLFNNSLCSYLMKDAAIPERKILAQKQQA